MRFARALLAENQKQTMRLGLVLIVDTQKPSEPRESSAPRGQRGERREESQEIKSEGVGVVGSGEWGVTGVGEWGGLGLET